MRGPDFGGQGLAGMRDPTEKPENGGGRWAETPEKMAARSPGTEA